MIDRLPTMHITATRTDEQMAQVRDYLFQLKEELEFILSNLSEENLSQELLDKLETLGADIEKDKEDKDEQFQQMRNNAVTVSDVLNSPTFLLELKKAIPTFKVNYETGQLEY